MPTNVSRDEVQQLVPEGAQLVEVLPREQYEQVHVAGALSIPLKELGSVYRYQPGDDWLAARLPLDHVGEIAEAVRTGNWPLAVVVNERRVVLGRLRVRDLADRSDAVAGDIMLDGPRTIGGTRAASEMGRWLDEREVPGVLVTTADGMLIGYVRREDV